MPALAEGIAPGAEGAVPTAPGGAVATAHPNATRAMRKAKTPTTPTKKLAA